MKVEHDFDEKEINKDDFHRKIKVVVKAVKTPSQKQLSSQAR